MTGAILLFLQRLSKRRSRSNLYDWVRGAIERAGFNGDSRLISIGAGGEIEEQLTRAKLTVTSVDIDPARQPDVVSDVEHLVAFEDASLDGVFVLEVLEHVRNPAAAVGEIRRVLRPGGIVIGSTPFLLAIHDEPYDYFRFTYYGILELFRDLEHVVLRERNGELEAAGVLLTRRFAHIPPDQFYRTISLAPFILLLSTLCTWLDRLLPSSRGTTGYFFVFRKPF